MSLSVETGRDRHQDIGLILTKVQDDLRRLKQKLADGAKSDTTFDFNALETAITKTEESVRVHAEHVIGISNDRVTTLPAVVQHKIPPVQHKHRMSNQKTHSVLPLASPGQEVQVKYMSKLLSQPTHPTTRQILHDTYGIPESIGHTHRTRRKKRQERVSGCTVGPLTRLPMNNRRDALLTPPPISSKDTQRGLLNLLERGLIPRSADIVLRPPPVLPKHLSLSNFSQQQIKVCPVDAIEGGTALAGVKFDLSSTESVKTLLPAISSDTEQLSTKPVLKTLHVHTASFEKKEEKRITQHQQTKSSIFKIPVQEGTVLQHNSDFKSFQLLYKDNWNNITRLLDHIELMARQYAISIIFVNGQELSKLATKYELEPKPLYKDLLPCILNSREVEHLLHMPGRRYKGLNGVHIAASKVQATYRMYVQRRCYLEYKRMKWAAGVIALAWVLYTRSCKVQQQLKDTRETHIKNYRHRLLYLGEKWNDIKQRHRVVVHIPSKGYLRHIRQGMSHFPVSQNLQLTRICDALDPNVEAIYVCPIEVEEELRDYYHELLDDRVRKSAGGRSHGAASDRVHFVTPEHLSSFGHHKLSLSSLLKYSPRAIKQIRSLVGERDAYIVPHVTCQDDLEISDRLNIPLLGVEPNLVYLYSTHSGRQQLFSDANITTPPNVREVYSFEHLIEGLAYLIVNNLLVQKWIFKIDHHVQGRGIAYCDIIPYLDCYDWIIKESQRYGEKWKKQWAQEYAIKKLILELPSVLAIHSVPANTGLFPTWSHYLQEFLSHGGSIEADPPSDSVTSVTIDLLLEPNNTHSILSTWDQIHSGPYQVWGGSMPQSSIEPNMLQDIINGLSDAASARGIVGHISVDLVTFIHPLNMTQVVWAVDLDFGPSDYVSMYSLISKLGDIHTDNTTGRLITSQNEERYAIVSTQLKHTNLSMVQYDVFFRMCKAHLIGYDQKNYTGIVFTLVESCQRQYLGMICIQSSLREALSSSSYALSAIHQEITTINMQGLSNFPTVFKELDEISKTVEVNEATSI